MNKTPSPYSTALRIWYIGWKHKNMRTSLSSPTNDCQLLTRIPKKQAGNGTPERVALKWAQNKMPWFPWAEQRQPLMHSASAVVRKFSQGEFLTSWAHRIRLQFQGPSLCLFVSLPCSPSPLTLTFVVLSYSFSFFLSPLSFIYWFPYQQISPYLGELITVAWVVHLLLRHSHLNDSNTRHNVYSL